MGVTAGRIRLGPHFDNLETAADLTGDQVVIAFLAIKEIIVTTLPWKSSPAPGNPAEASERR
jgi:hypothetical protein